MSSFAKPDKDDEEGGDEGADTVVGGESEEPTGADYVPIVKLNKLAEVITHEEDEDIAYCQRVKLNEFGETLLNKGTGIKEWKEKGIGELKILKHKTSGKNRILMRQEKTLKICANFYCDHRIPELKALNGSDKAWVVSSPADFSDATTPTSRIFSVRFNAPEQASEFKAKWDVAQSEMKAIFEAKAKDPSVDDAAEALAKVAIADKTEPAGGDADKTEPAGGGAAPEP